MQRTHVLRCLRSKELAHIRPFIEDVRELSIRDPLECLRYHNLIARRLYAIYIGK
jgi:hypothetical protein